MAWKGRKETRLLRETIMSFFALTPGVIVHGYGNTDCGISIDV